MFNQVLKISSIGLFTALALALSANNAKAILFGDDVTLQYGPTGFTPTFNETSTVTDPGVEFNIPESNPIPVDIKGNSFEITFNLKGFPFVGTPTTFILSDLDWTDTPGIVNKVTVASDNGSKVTSRSFTDDSITINFSNFKNPHFDDPSASSDDQKFRFNFNIETVHTSAVPFEFSPTLGILILGSIFGISRLRLKSYFF